MEKPGQQQETASPPAHGLGGTLLLLHGADALGEGAFLPGG